MAINPTDPVVLMLEGCRERFRGNLLTLGRQEIVVRPEQVLRQADRVGYRVDEQIAGSHAHHLSDEAFFRMLGFTSVSSLDANDYEAATFIHDLNQEDVPKELEERFDVVLNRGTSEHVFHLPNLLNTVGRMVKPGGRVIHFVPSSNHIDHGFYMFSPTLFFDYYTASGYEVPTLWLVAQPWLRARPTVEILEYRPGCLESVNHGGLDDRTYQVFCVAVRSASAGVRAVPTQGRYTRMWAEHPGPAGSASASVWRRTLSPLIRRLRSTRAGDALVGTVVNPIKKRLYFRKGPRVLHRYQV